jgi:predicted metalloprotease with PDZ domain
MRLATPTWVPGAYALLKYARDVIEVHATDVDSGAELAVARDG